MLKKGLIIASFPMIFFLVVAEQDKQSKWNYIHEYLPDESLVHLRCSQEERCACNIWIFKSKECQSCDYINAELKDMDADQQPDYSKGMDGFLGAILTIFEFYRKVGNIKESVFDLLPNNNDEEIWDECQNICDAITKIEQQRIDRLNSKKA